MKRAWLIGGAVTAGLFLVVALGFWLLFDANGLRPALEAQLSASLGRHVTVGGLRLAVLSGGLSVDDLAIADNPAFSAQPFITAKNVTVGVDLLPLVFSRTLRVEAFRLDQPRVVLLRDPRGTWNFSRVSAASSPQTTGSASTSAMTAAIQRITIVGGQVLVGTTGAPGKERIYTGVNLDASHVSFASRFPMHVTATLPGGGSVTLDGEAGPFNPGDAARTPFQASMHVERLDIASTGFVGPASGLAGLVSFRGAWASDGKTMNSKGTVTATQLQLLAGSTPSRVPIEIDYASDYATNAERGALTENDVHIGNAVARLTGEYTLLAGDAPVVRMRLVGQKMPVADLEGALPAIGVTLPSGASFKQGALEADLAINGPVDRLVVTGPINLTGATMAGFDLGTKLAAIAALAGLPKSGQTNIETLSSTIRFAPQGLQIGALNLVVSSVGALAGSGTIAPSGAMEFTMVAKLTGSGAGARGLSRVASLGQPANGIPFRIQGTTRNPVFVPDIRKAADNALKSGEQKAKERVGDFLKRRK